MVESRVVALLCLAEALSMLGFSVYPALLPVVRDGWGLSNAGAGLVSGVYFGGYMAAVPLLTAPTDRGVPGWRLSFRAEACRS